MNTSFNSEIFQRLHAILISSGKVINSLTYFSFNSHNQLLIPSIEYVNLWILCGQPPSF